MVVFAFYDAVFNAINGVPVQHRLNNMISIKPSCVPEYLRKSAFCANLGGDDEEVCVPEDCCKLDTSVTNAADLEGLLCTLRFWGEDRIPITVLRFILSNDRAVWDPVTVKYVSDLAFVAQLLRVEGCERDKQVCEAASLRNVDVVSCLLEHGRPAEYQPGSGSCNIPIACAVDISAGNGDLVIVKVLKLHNCEFTENTGRAAARGGHYEFLEYLLQNGCPVAKDLINCAMRSGKVEVIQYLHDRGFPWPEDILQLLFKNEKVNKETMGKVKVCIACAYKLGCPYDPHTCYFASMHGWYDILVDAHQHKGELHAHCTLNAPTNGHLDCLTYLHENGCPWEERSTTASAAANNHFDCLKYAVEHGCPVPTYTYSSVLFSGSVEMVQYLREKGAPWPSNILSGIRNSPRVFMHSENVENVGLCLKFAYLSLRQ